MLEERTVEDIYPLSPMQEGMLFHSLFAGPAEAPLLQWRCRFEDGLDVEAFRRAWDSVVERHPILRTAFVLDDVEEPLQVVFRTIELPWKETDFRDLGSADRAAALTAYLEKDRDSSFDITAAPLLRLGVVRLDEKTYFFHWTFHLLLLDGWSTALVLKEVLELYDGFRRGVEPRLERNRRYRDYIAWLQRQDPSSAEAFWRKTLKGIFAPTPLVVAKTPARSGSTGRTEQRRAHFSAADTRALQDFARAHRLTLNTLLRGAWALLLSRYSGEETVVFGATVAGRPAELEGVESIAGLFINTLPVRVNVPEEGSVLSWLTRLQQEQAELLLYQFSRLVDVQGWSDVPRGLPLFESILVVQTLPGDDHFQARSASLGLQEEENFERTNDPLTVKVVPAEELLLEASFDSDRFEAETIDRMLSHFQTLLRLITKEPEGRIGEISALTETETHRLLVEWNATRVDDPRIEMTLPQLFEQQVDRTPSATALVFKEESLAYRELDRRANQLANFLRARGVARESVVGICLGRSFDMVTAVLAILKAGGAYVPLDPSNPPQRLSFLMQDSGTSVVVSEDRLAAALPGIGNRSVRLDSDAEEIARQSGDRPAGGPHPEDLAYLMYTSGSTGRPKGVLVEHRNVVNLLESMRRRPGLDSDDVLLAVTTLSFDIAGLEIYLPLTTGASVVIAPRDAVSDGAALGRLLESSGATVMQATPATWRLLLDSGWSGSARLKALCGGEALPGELARQLACRCGSLWNMYGPTETTIWSSIARFDGPEDRVTIGRPIANTRMYVLDSELRLVPVGVAGELFIGGAGVARGYWNRPELTAQKFLPDPFGEGGSRLYRTGDWVRHLEEGEVEYLGRLDGQVKIRGHRIELGEIESALSQISGIREAVVIAREDEPGDKRLVAYVIADSDNERLTRECRESLKRVLPEYMVPSAFVVLDRFSLTPSGKVDRRGLPVPQKDRRETEQTFVPPRSPTEEVLAGIWSRVLKVSQVGIRDNFFELGGHSLLATQVFARIRELLGVELPLRYLFENPTVADLADRVEQARRGETEGEPPLVQVSRDLDLPASFAQQRLWFLHQLQPGTSAYNARRVLRLKGQLDRNALERALTEVVRRHESLRTTFRDGADGLVQVISAPFDLTIGLQDLSDVASGRREEEARRRIQEEVARFFDLARGPLLRASLFRLGPQEHIFSLVVHHIVSDGWSIAVLLRDLEALYGSFSRGEPSPLASLPLQYADYAVWERQRLGGEKLEKLLAYCVEQLREVQLVLDLKGDRPRPALRTGGGGRHHFVISDETTRRLTDLSRAEGVTIYMTLLAAYAVLLWRQTGQDQIVVGSPNSGRSRVETEDLIGLFINTMVLCVDLRGNPSFRELMLRVRETALGAYAHQELPFEKLVDALKLDRSLAHNPIFQVWFVLHNIEETPPGFPGLSVSEIALGTEATRHDLQLSISETGAALEAQWDYAADIFEPATIGRLARDLQGILEKAAARPGASLEELRQALEREAVQQDREERDELERDAVEKLRAVKRRAVRL